MIDSNLPIIHIGLGKTGSTYLQKKIFPKLCKFINYHYFKDDNKLFKKLNEHKINLKLGFKTNKIELNNNSFISMEGLSSWGDPFYWEDHSIQNLKAFGSNVNILIFIRKPSDFLTSTFIQRCFHKGNIMEESFFFLKDQFYSERINSPKFAIDKFSYKDLIDFYRQKFRNVFVFKYELLNNLEFLKILFKLDEDQLKFLQKKNSSKDNKSFSNSSIILTKKISKFLNLFSLDFVNGAKNVSLRTISQLKEKKLKYEFKNYRWRYFVQNYLDKYFFHKPYIINFDRINIDINELNNEYKALDDHYIFKS